MSINSCSGKVLDIDGRQTLRSLFTVQVGEYVVPDHIKNEDNSVRKAHNAARVAQVEALMTTKSISMHKQAAEEVRQMKIKMMSGVGITREVDIIGCLNLGSTDFRNLIAYKKMTLASAALVPIVAKEAHVIALPVRIEETVAPSPVLVAIAAIEPIVTEETAPVAVTPANMADNVQTVINDEHVISPIIRTKMVWADVADEEDKTPKVLCVKPLVRSEPTGIANLAERKLAEIKALVAAKVEIVKASIIDPENRTLLPSTLKLKSMLAHSGNVKPNRRERRIYDLYLAEEKRVRQQHMKSFAWTEVAGALGNVLQHNTSAKSADYMDGLYITDDKYDIGNSDCIAPPEVVVVQESYEGKRYGWSNHCDVDEEIETICEEFLAANNGYVEDTSDMNAVENSNQIVLVDSPNVYHSEVSKLSSEVKAIYKHLGLEYVHADSADVTTMVTMLNSQIGDLCTHLGLVRSSLEIGGAFRPPKGARGPGNSIPRGRGDVRSRSSSRSDNTSASPSRSSRSESRTQRSDFCIETPTTSRSAASPGPRSGVAGGEAMLGVVEMLELPALGRGVGVIEKEVLEALKPLPATSQRVIKRLKGRITKARAELQDDVTITLKERNNKAIQRHEERTATINESRLNFIEKDVLKSDSIALMEREMAEYMADAAAQKAGLQNQFTIKEFDAKFSRYEINNSSEFALSPSERGIVGMRPELRKRLLAAAATVLGGGILIAGSYLLVSVLHDKNGEHKHLVSTTKDEHIDGSVDGNGSHKPKVDDEDVVSEPYNDDERDLIDEMRVYVMETIKSRSTTDDIKVSAQQVLLEMSRADIASFANITALTKYVMEESRLIASSMPTDETEDTVGFTL